MHFLSLIKDFVPLVFYILLILLSIRAWSGNTQLTLCFLVFLIPLRNIIDHVQNFPFGSQIINILAISIAIGWVAYSSGKNIKLLQNATLNYLAVILIFYIVFSLLRGNFYLYSSLALDFDDQRVKDCKNFCLLPILFFITFNTVRTKEHVMQVFLAICLALFLCDYYTVSQISWYSSLGSREKISGTFQFLGPNEVAAFLNQATVLLLAVCFFIKKKLSKILLWVLVAINTYCITFLYSRGAYLGLFIGLFFLFSFKKRFLLVPLILLGLFWQFFLPPQVVQRIEDTIGHHGQLDESSERRVEIWGHALDLFKENPIVGIGFGSFRNMGFDLKDTHNIYVKILTEQGLIGFIIFLGIIFCFIKDGLKLYFNTQDDFSKGIGLGFAVSITVLMVNNLFGDRWAYLEVSAYLWVFAGLVARLNLINTKVESFNFVKSTTPANSPAVLNESKNNIKKSKKKVRYYDL